MQINIQNKFTTQLPADTLEENEVRQVTKACYSFVTPKEPSNPLLIHTSEEVAKLIGLSKVDLKSADFLNVFTGKSVYKNTTPYAMCYAGHQFGNWAL